MGRPVWGGLCGAACVSRKCRTAYVGRPMWDGLCGTAYVGRPVWDGLCGAACVGWPVWSGLCGAACEGPGTLPEDPECHLGHEQPVTVNSSYLCQLVLARYQGDL